MTVEIVGPALPHGRVTHRTLSVSADASDEDQTPDLASIPELTVRLIPSVKYVVWTGEGGPVTHVPQPINGRYAEDGRLFLSGGYAEVADGIEILATSHPDVQPSGWHWTAEWSDPSLPSGDFTLEPGQTLDLSVVILASL